MSGELFTGAYPPPNPMFSGHKRRESGNSNVNNNNPNKDLHMFVWSSTASPVSEAHMRNAVNKAANSDFANIDAAKAVFQNDAAPSRGKSTYKSLMEQLTMCCQYQKC